MLMRAIMQYLLCVISVNSDRYSLIHSPGCLPVEVGPGLNLVALIDTAYFLRDFFAT